MKSLKLPNNEYFSIYMQIVENKGKLNCFSRIMDKYSSAADSVCTTYVKKNFGDYVCVVFVYAECFIVRGLRGVLCAMICPLILTHNTYRGPIENF